MSLLQVRDLTIRIGATAIVERVSFSIAERQTFALLGESGCGKSMTALALMRLLPSVAKVTGGAVELEKTDLLRLPEYAMRRVRGADIAMVFQEPMVSLNPVMRVGQQIVEVLACHAVVPPAQQRAEAVRLLQAVGIPEPEHRLDAYPFELSGGMKQRVMIAMALAGSPRLLVADEPTTALDVTIQKQVLDLLRQLQQQRGMGMLLITHDLGVVAEMADQVGVMYAGELVEVASRATLFANPQHPYTQALFAAQPSPERREESLQALPGMVSRPPQGCRLAPRCPKVEARCRVEAPQLRELADGHAVRCHFAGAPVARQTGSAVPVVAAAAPVLEVRDLAVHFPIRSGLLQRVSGHVKAVDGVSLAIARGKTVALVGESGCGKTTVGRAILQLLKATAGSIRFAGQELTGLDRRAMRPYRQAIQVIFQDPYSSLNPRMRVADILEEGMLALGVGKTAAERQQTVLRLLEQVGLPAEAAERYPHEFSGGQRQRIAIARALAVRPQIIICDEPTSALDVSVQAQILNLLRQLQQEQGLGYLFISHNLAVVSYLADEVAVMYLGRIVESGPVQQIMQAPAHPYTQLLLSAAPSLEGGGKPSVIPVKGELPSPIHPPAGCHFHPRCPRAMAECSASYPVATVLAGGQVVRCHLFKAG